MCMLVAALSEGRDGGMIQILSSARRREGRCRAGRVVNAWSISNARASTAGADWAGACSMHRRLNRQLGTAEGSASASAGLRKPALARSRAILKPTCQSPPSQPRQHRRRRRPRPASTSGRGKDRGSKQCDASWPPAARAPSRRSPLPQPLRPSAAPRLHGPAAAVQPGAVGEHGSDELDQGHVAAGEEEGRGRPGRMTAPPAASRAATDGEKIIIILCFCGSCLPASAKPLPWHAWQSARSRPASGLQAASSGRRNAHSRMPVDSASRMPVAIRVPVALALKPSRTAMPAGVAGER